MKFGGGRSCKKKLPFSPFDEIYCMVHRCLASENRAFASIRINPKNVKHTACARKFWLRLMKPNDLTIARSLQDLESAATYRK